MLSCARHLFYICNFKDSLIFYKNLMIHSSVQPSEPAWPKVKWTYYKITGCGFTQIKLREMVMRNLKVKVLWKIVLHQKEAQSFVKLALGFVLKQFKPEQFLFVQHTKSLSHCLQFVNINQECCQYQKLLFFNYLCHDTASRHQRRVRLQVMRPRLRLGQYQSQK